MLVMDLLQSLAQTLLHLSPDTMNALANQAGQWLYVIPLIISLRRKQRFQVAKGLLITACVLFGVDVLCSGIVIYSLGHTSFR